MLDLAQRRSFMRAPDYRGDGPVWQWTLRPDGIAVLRMDGWGLYNSTWDWASWLHDRLDSLTGANGFIVDIRANEGGMDCGDLILARLASGDIVKPKLNRMVRYVNTPAHLNPYLDTWDDSFRDWSSQITAREGAFYRLRQNADAAITASSKKRLNVPMAVLTSAQNSSATFQFAALVKQLAVGVLVGETTGGNQRGINGGSFFFARLPDSGLEFDVPLIGFFPEGKKPDAGITPDIFVQMTAQAIASDVDPQMQAAVGHLLQT
jgi:C-terminal processing protease CtpA/Prc